MKVKTKDLYIPDEVLSDLPDAEVVYVVYSGEREKLKFYEIYEQKYDAEDCISKLKAKGINANAKASYISWRNYPNDYPNVENLVMVYNYSNYHGFEFLIHSICACLEKDKNDVIKKELEAFDQLFDGSEQKFPPYKNMKRFAVYLPFIEDSKRKRAFA